MVLALLGFGLRALIPIGFEPAHGSLSLVLCHEGFPARFFSPLRGTVSHGGHAGTGVHDSHCAFCNGTSPAPAFSLAAIAGIRPVAIGLIGFFQSSSRSVPLAHIPQARAPPRPV